jgi:hypothetical protein
MSAPDTDTLSAEFLGTSSQTHMEAIPFRENVMVTHVFTVSKLRRGMLTSYSHFAQSRYISTLSVICLSGAHVGTPATPRANTGIPDPAREGGYPIGTLNQYTEIFGDVPATVRTSRMWSRW